MTTSDPTLVEAVKDAFKLKFDLMARLPEGDYEDVRQQVEEKLFLSLRQGVLGKFYGKSAAHEALANRVVEEAIKQKYSFASSSKLPLSSEAERLQEKADEIVSLAFLMQDNAAPLLPDVDTTNRKFFEDRTLSDLQSVCSVFFYAASLPEVKPFFPAIMNSAVRLRYGEQDKIKQYRQIPQMMLSAALPNALRVEKEFKKEENGRQVSEWKWVDNNKENTDVAAAIEFLNLFAHEDLPEICQRVYLEEMLREDWVKTIDFLDSLPEETQTQVLLGLVRGQSDQAIEKKCMPDALIVTEGQDSTPYEPEAFMEKIQKARDYNAGLHQKAGVEVLTYEA